MLGMPFSTTPYAMQPDCLRATGGTQPGAGAWLAGASFGAQPGAGAWLAGTPDGALPIQSLMHSERSPPKSLGEMLVPTSPQTSTLARCTSIDFDSQGSEMQTTPGALPSALALQHSSEGTFAAGKQEISHATVALASPSEPLQALARCTSIDFDSQGSETQPTPIALPGALALQHSSGGTFAASKQQTSHALVALASPSEPRKPPLSFDAVGAHAHVDDKSPIAGAELATSVPPGGETSVAAVPRNVVELPAFEAAEAKQRPIAPSGPLEMLEDFLAMTRSRASDKKRKAADQSVGQTVATSPTAPPAAKEQKTEAPPPAAKEQKTEAAPPAAKGQKTEVKVEWESTRSTFRVRLLIGGERGCSRGFRYTPGDAASKAKAEADAKALAIKWGHESSA